MCEAWELLMDFRVMSNSLNLSSAYPCENVVILFINYLVDHLKFVDRLKFVLVPLDFSIPWHHLSCTLPIGGCDVPPLVYMCILWLCRSNNTMGTQR